MQDGYRILGSGKSGKMAKIYQHHKFPPCLGNPSMGERTRRILHTFSDITENTIRLSADILIASAHALIVFLSATNKAATKRKHTPPQSLFFLVGEEITHCPPTVPSGDTPCLTAGDARRANPWRELHSSLRHQRCRTASTFTHTSLYSLNAFSVTPPASEVDGVLPIHGFTLATARASPAVKHGAPPLEA